MVKTEEAQAVWCCALYHYVSSVHSLPKNYGSLRIPLVNHRAEGLSNCSGPRNLVRPLTFHSVECFSGSCKKKETFHKKKLWTQEIVEETFKKLVACSFPPL